MIWDTYLCERASTQICVPSLIFDNTIKRLKLLNLYGPHVFDETMIDPMKTLAKDIYPRFIVSEYFRELRCLFDAMNRLKRLFDAVTCMGIVEAYSNSRVFSFALVMVNEPAA
jgi:hypothetical protein